MRHLVQRLHHMCLQLTNTLDIGDTPTVTVDGASYGAVTTAADSATTAATTLNALLHAVSGLTGTDNADGTITVVSTGVAEFASTFADVATNAADCVRQHCDHIW